jgi:hypothetical protein
MERAMRKQKRLAVGYDAAGLTDDFTAAAVRLSRMRATYKNFSKTAGLYTQFERATVAEMSRKVAGKTAAITRKLNGLTNSRKSGKIKDMKRPNRDKKYLITDEAINKIGLAEIIGFTNEQNLKLQQFHKEILTIAKNKNNSNEVLRVWNPFVKGENYVDILGTENEVKTGNNTDLMTFVKKSYDNELVYLHNHPSRQSFSYVDIRTFVENDKIGVMTVVTNNGNVYTISKTDNYTYEKSSKLFNETIKELGGSGEIIDEEFIEKFAKTSRKAGIIYGKDK